MKNDNKEIHNKKRNNLLWMGFFILLTILHLPFVWILAYIVPHLIDISPYILMLSPIFLPLVIVDFISFILFIKESPPWKLCFILLAVCNALSFSEATNAMSGYMGAMNAIFVVPLALVLLIIDLIAVLSYIITQRHNGKARFI